MTVYKNELEAAAREERRRGIRRRVAIESVLLDPQRRLRFSCLVVDLSAKGAGIRCPDAESLPETVILLLHGSEAMRRVCEIVRRGKDRIGVRFKSA